MATSEYFGPTIGSGGGGSGTPGGSSGDIQYNNGGSFGGFGDWDGSTLTIPGDIEALSATLPSGLTLGTDADPGGNRATLLREWQTVTEAIWDGHDDYRPIEQIIVLDPTNNGHTFFNYLNNGVESGNTKTFASLINMLSNIEGGVGDVGEIGGIQSNAFVNSNIATRATAFYGVVFDNLAAGKTSAADIAIYAFPQLDGDGTVTFAAGMQIYPAYVPGAGTVTTSAGINIGTNGPPTGTITTGYGLLIDDQSGTATTAYNLFSAGAMSVNRFEGNVQIAMQTPASAGAAGVKDTIAFDTGFIYICTATNTWKRVAIATWP